MSDFITRLRESVDFIRNIYSQPPEAGIVLGSGLGSLLKEVEVAAAIPYEEIPHFPVATVEGHEGRLIFGQLANRRVVVMSGRFHYYEGYSAAEVVYPIRVMKQLGIDYLLVSNAAGGVNTSFQLGDLMIIRDHIALGVPSPLRGKNEESLGIRFPDMSEPYCRKLIAKLKAVGSELGIPLREGVYFGVTGPNFETRAEYKMIAALGADAVGMSTVQEVIAARHMGIPVAAVSVIANLGIREADNQVTHEEVLESARRAEPALATIFKQLIAKL